MVNDSQKKQIDSEIREALLGVNWSKAFFQINVSSDGTFGGGIGYYENDDNFKIPHYIDEKGRQNVKELKSYREICQYFIDYYHESEMKDSKWNKSFFYVFPNGENQIDFVWDSAFYAQNEINLAKASVTILYERFYEILSFEILPDVNWEKAEVKCFVYNNFTKIEVIVLDKILNLTLPQKWEKYLMNFHLKTNGEMSNIFWGNWNNMIVKMKYIDNFNFDKDVEFNNEISTVL